MIIARDRDTNISITYMTYILYITILYKIRMEFI